MVGKVCVVCGATFAAMYELLSNRSCASDRHECLQLRVSPTPARRWSRAYSPAHVY